MFLIGVAGFAVTSALCGLAPSAGVLIGARALQAAFAALVSPTSLALILPEFPPQRRPFAIGVWGAMGAVAAALGPTSGALLIQNLSWRWIFLVNVPVFAVTHGLPDPVGAALIAVIPAALSLAIIEGPRWGWSDERVVGSFVVAVLMLPVFLVRTRRVARPVMDLALFKSAQFRLVNAATLIFAAAFFGALLATLVFPQTVWHYSVLRAALAASPGPVMVAVLARVSPSFSQTYGPRRVLTTGAVLYRGALAAYAAWVGTTPHWLYQWLPLQAVLGAGIGFTLPVQSTAAVQELPPGRLAVGSAINAAFRQLGAVLGISLFVAVVGRPGPAAALDAFHRFWWLFAALGLASGAMLWTTPGALGRDAR